MTEQFIDPEIGFEEDKTDLPESQTHIRVWDIPTRIFHWLLVISFVVAYASNWLGVSYFTWHLWSGYFVIILVVFRLLWGVLGSHYAQFSNFLHHPIETIRYAKQFASTQAKFYAGHNPLGSLMVILLLAGMLIQAITGLFSNDEIFNAGPLYGYITHDLSLALTSVHKDLFYWILGAVGLHVAAALFYLFVKRENLIKPMITGKKPAIKYEGARSITSSRVWLALVLVVIISAVLAAIIVTAPAFELDVGY